jgi:hypothetical protein
MIDLNDPWSINFFPGRFIGSQGIVGGADVDGKRPEG